MAYQLINLGGGTYGAYDPTTQQARSFSSEALAKQFFGTDALDYKSAIAPSFDVSKLTGSNADKLVSLAPAPTISPIETTVPTATGTPELPAPNALGDHQTILGTQTENLASSRTALEDAYKKRLADIDAQKAATQAEIDRLTNTEQKTIQGPVNELAQPFRNRMEEIGRSKYHVDENFQANQKLTNELDQLLTEGNAMMKRLSDSKVPGLAGIQQSPRLLNQLNDVQARAGVINAVLAARSNQISTAENLIDRSVGAVTSDRKDQLNYYKTLLDFYDKQRDEKGRKLVDLTNEEQTYLKSQIGLLENDLSRSQETADAVKKLMTDPETALLAAKSGITLNDSPEEINKKLGAQIEMDTNLTAIKAAGITTRFADFNGQIQNAQTGYAYTSPEDFQARTGMSVQQAQDAGMITKYEPTPEGATAQQKDYLFYAAQEKAAGREPISFNQFIHQSRGGGGGGGSTRSGNYVFTQTQLNKGVSNSGLSRDDFLQLDPEIQNFFISTPTAELGNIDAELGSVADGSLSIDDFMADVEALGYSDTVNQYIRSIAEGQAPADSGDSGGGFWSNLWDNVSSGVKNFAEKGRAADQGIISGVKNFFNKIF